MAAKSTLTADSVGQREFVIRYTLTAFPMTLYRCWNLVAMPVVPVVTQSDLLSPPPLLPNSRLDGVDSVLAELAPPFEAMARARD